jgi:hypothetical protein
MTKKKQRTALGRVIRRETGIPFPLAMLAAKKFVAGMAFDLKYDERYDSFVKHENVCGDRDCCGTEAFLEGPKGRYDRRL